MRERELFKALQNVVWALQSGEANRAMEIGEAALDEFAAIDLAEAAIDKATTITQETS